LQKYDAWTGLTTDYSFGTNVSRFVDNVSTNVPDPLWGNILMVSYEVQAHYGTLGDSAWAGPVPLDQTTLVAAFVAGPQGSAYVAVPVIPVGTVALQVTRFDKYAWDQYYYLGGTAPYITNFTIPVSSSTNGLYLIPPSWCVMQPDAYGYADFYEWSVQTLNTNGLPTATRALYQGYNFEIEDNRGWLVPPYFDGRAQLKQNLIFLLRAAPVDTPLVYLGANTNNFDIYNFTNPPAYAYAGFYQLDENANDPFQYENVGSFDVYWPFENNCRYRNFVFNATNLDSNGRITTGAGGNYGGNYIPGSGFNGGYGDFVGGLYLLYPTSNQFQAPASSGATIPSLLATNDTRWLASYALDSGFSWLWKIGATNNSEGVNGLFNNVSNWYGLPFLSVNIAYNAGSSFATNLLYAGNTTTAGGDGGYFYPETAQPQFQTVEYDFWNANWPYNDLLPGQAGFSLTNTSRLLITSVGITWFPVGYIYGPYAFRVNGYAKLAVANSYYSGVYGYLGQYFDQAHTMTNGVATTNTTGILSPYGDFFATQPGPAALVTMPDPDTGQRGTCTVYCVSLALDKNHDGNMDLSWNGPDATSQGSPFRFWANNNYDRWATNSSPLWWSLLGISYTDDEQDDQKIAFSPAAPITPTPDCNYSNQLANGYSYRAIPCTRDLEDFARLWVCGITTNLLAALPAGSTITLSWGDVGNPNSADPTIDIFQAADLDGGIGYLTNETTATIQTNILQCPYVGRLGPGGSIQLNTIRFVNSWAGNHFIWCGVSNGTGGLNLTISDASGNVLVQSTAYIQIVDIKQMYERWTVGDIPTTPPATTPTLVSDDSPAGMLAFQYTWPTDTNTIYILHVHGYNLEPWQKDRFAETEFKRLYWQGYQGRFGLFRWPTTFTPYARAFDDSESNAWASAAGLLTLLTNLNAEYPGNVYLTAHSHGAVVAGEALRQATQQGLRQIVNTYVVMQGAVDSHTYDPTTPTRAVSFSTPDRYGQYYTNGAPCYFNGSAGAGTYVNFFNTNDFALATNIWQRDQNMKPDSGYDYSATFDRWYRLGAVSSIQLFFPQNTYEIFSYCDQAHAYALGAQPNVGGSFISLGVTNQVSLPSVWPPDTSGGNYSAHIWHSAEFRSDYPQRWLFWNEVLFQMGL
jgi:hypothetical protein